MSADEGSILPLKERVHLSFLDFKDERGVKRSASVDKVAQNYYQWLQQWFPYLACDLGRGDTETNENNLKEWIGELHAPRKHKHKHKHKHKRRRSESPPSRSKKSKK